MNERIKELEQQALSIVLNGNDPDGDVERMYIPSEFTKKLAELIVRECADYVQFYYKDHACEIIAHDMKQHFGVK